MDLARRTPRARGLKDGDAIRIYNERGEMHARAQVTDDVPPGTVWMRDGWIGLNELHGRSSGHPGRGR